MSVAIREEVGNDGSYFIKQENEDVDAATIDTAQSRDAEDVLKFVSVKIEEPDYKYEGNILKQEEEDEYDEAFATTTRELCKTEYEVQDVLKLEMPAYSCEDVGDPDTIESDPANRTWQHPSSELSAEGKQYGCRQCGKRFPRLDHLQKHQVTHKRVGPFRCEQCEKGFYHKRSLKSHIFTHTGSKPYQCEICEIGFSFSYKLKRHLLTHTMPHVCQQCGKSFSGEAGLTWHMFIHFDGKPYQCTQCNKSFKKKFSLKTHMLIHTGHKQHRCEKCGRLFLRIDGLRRHMVTHTGQSRYQCKDCGKMFSQSGSLKKHLEGISGKQLACQKCKIRFSRMICLKTHMLTHMQESPNQCLQCGRVFSEINKLKRHMRTHPRIYPCKVCGQIFFLDNNLKAHMPIHVGEEPFQCHFCGKGFFRKVRLITHILKHTAEKPFRCEHWRGFCQEGSFQSAHPNTHWSKKGTTVSCVRKSILKGTSC